MSRKKRRNAVCGSEFDLSVYRREPPKGSIEVSALKDLAYGETVNVVGRIMLTDNTGKISMLGVFSKLEEKDVITLERIEGNGSSFPAYLDRTPANVNVVNHVLHCGDIVVLKGVKMRTDNRDVFLGEGMALLSKATKDVYDSNIDFHKKSNTHIHRHLQFIQDPEKISHFHKCSLVFRVVRQFLYQKGYEEVNTTLLQKSFEAGLADPFVTHTAASNRKMFLRLSAELLLWRLMVAGFSKVFEIGKSFRNQSATVNTLPQFTILELYQAYAGSEEMETLARDMIHEILIQLNGCVAIPLPTGEVIDCSGEWDVYDFKDEVNKITGTSYDEKCSPEELICLVDKMGIPRPTIINKYTIASSLYSHVMSRITGPAFLRNLPAAQSPLYKLNDDESTVDETLLVVGGRPIVTIVNPERDPALLKRRMEEQLTYRTKGQSDALNEGIIATIKFGLPPCRGIAIGMEHLLMFLLNLENIRDAELFPVF